MTEAEIAEMARKVIDLEIYLTDRYRQDAKTAAKTAWILNALKEHGLKIVEIEPGSCEAAKRRLYEPNFS